MNRHLFCDRDSSYVFYEVDPREAVPAVVSAPQRIAGLRLPPAEALRAEPALVGTDHRQA
jgi:hypothetical protein